MMESTVADENIEWERLLSSSDMWKTSNEFFIFGIKSILLTPSRFTISTKSTIGSDFLSKEIDIDGRPVSLQVL
jgi:hypothetical protein